MNLGERAANQHLSELALCTVFRIFQLNENNFYINFRLHLLRSRFARASQHWQVVPASRAENGMTHLMRGLPGAEAAQIHEISAEIQKS
jgi:hypothetical protein